LQNHGPLDFDSVKADVDILFIENIDNCVLTWKLIKIKKIEKRN